MLTGIRLEIDDANVSVAATDRYRIAARDFLWRPARPGLRAAVMVPARVLVEVARTLRAGEVSIALDDSVAGFESVGRRTTVRLLDEQFIDYRSRLTADWPIHAELPVAPLIDAIKRVALVAERNTAIRLSFSPGQLLVQAGGGDIGRGTEVLEADLDGDDIRIAFQPQWLLDGLAGVETERVRINMDSPTKPALLTGEGGESDFRYLVMSLRLA
jgi:DNA polymerase sliding clamp subunit (PCNA homolog)